MEVFLDKAINKDDPCYITESNTWYECEQTGMGTPHPNWQLFLRCETCDGKGKYRISSSKRCLCSISYTDPRCKHEECSKCNSIGQTLIMADIKILEEITGLLEEIKRCPPKRGAPCMECWGRRNRLKTIINEL